MESEWIWPSDLARLAHPKTLQGQLDFLARLQQFLVSITGEHYMTGII